MAVDPCHESEPLFELRAAGAADDDFLVALFAATHGEDLKEHLHTTDTVDQLLRLQFNAQRQSYFARFPASAPSIVVFQEESVGLWWIAESPEEYRILDVAIAPEFRNRKIGTLLVAQLLAAANRSGKPVRSSVAKTNGGSIRFHQRLSFRISTSDDVYVQLEYLPMGSRELSGPVR